MSEEAEFHHVAVVGLAGRFPGARDIDELWRNLENGVESITFFSDDELRAAGISAETLAAPNYVKAKPVLAGADLFDAVHFGYSPAEAELMDPQHRVFLECAWKALDHAGYDPWRFAGRIGLFAGVSANTYLRHLLANPGALERASDMQVVIGNDKDFLPTRVSYKLNLRGPSLSVQTACSSSLVATHLACQSLINQESDLALAGGVSVKVPLKTGYFHLEGGHRSPDGHCRAFDAAANGTAFGEGVGIVVLKLLANALADGDTIHAVIRGSAINNDGALKVGFTAPGVEGQAEVLAEALAVAGVSPETVGLVEAHGTGTTLGDPIEFEALAQAYSAAGGESGWCALGSVKTNLGHLDAAAGVTGLIKVILSLRHRKLPPSLHFERPNPRLALDGSPFYINTRLRPWEAGGARRAGVSSFGVGGTNAHAILEEPPAPAASGPSRAWQILTLSARTEEALAAQAQQLAAALTEDGDAPSALPALADIAYTLQVGRQALEHRAIAVCRATGEAAAALRGREILTATAGTASRAGAGRAAGQQQAAAVVFLFPGQGTQYPGMSAAIYAAEAAFRQEIDRCAEGLRPHLEIDLRQILGVAGAKAGGADLDATRFAQPALFAVEYALARLWMSWGIQPVAMLGHSVGELVAACLAGVFSLADGLAVVAARGALMQAQPPGAMLAVPLPAAEVAALLNADLNSDLNSDLALAAINAPNQCVVSGTLPAVEALALRLAERGVEGKRLNTSHAFHSPMMEPVLAPFEQRLAGLPLRPPAIPFASCLTGTWITAGEATDPAYWSRQLRGTVRFGDALAEVHRAPGRVLLEVGPGRSLAALARRLGGANAISSLADRADEERSLAQATGRLWQAGASVDWGRYHAREHRRRVPLPTYPFAGRRYWLEPTAAAREVAAAGGTAGALSRRADLADWFSVASWKRLGPLLAAAPDAGSPGPWLLWLDESGIGEEVARCLRAAGQEVTCVPPDAAEDDDRLLAAAGGCRKLVYLGSLGPAADAPRSPSADLLDRSWHRLVRLAQALGRRPARPGEVEVELSLVTDGIFEVVGGERLAPEKAALLGPLHVVPLELPHVACRAIEVDLAEALRDLPALGARLAAELLAAPERAEVALRRGYRWGRSLEPLRLPPGAPERARLRSGGVYLITGGTGALGLVVAKVLAEALPVRLALVARTPLPPPAEWAAWVSGHAAGDPLSRRLVPLLQLAELGAELLVLTADVADPAALDGAIAATLARFGRLDGVVHAAGVAGGGVLLRQSREVAERVLAPKVDGALHLERALAGRTLDWVWLFSSVNALYGGLGQIDYAAANAVLDTLAHRWSAGGTPVTAIDWDAWSEVGMASPRALPALPAPPALGLAVAGSAGLAEEIAFESELAVGGGWVADEHHLLGRAMMPGTAYLELARALFAAVEPGVPVEIADVVFVAPLAAAAAARRVRSTLRGTGGEYSFEIASRPAAEGDGAWQTHAVGNLRPSRAAAAALPAAARSLAALAAAESDRAADRELVRSWWSDPAEPSGLQGDEVAQYGPRWRSLVDLRVGDGAAVAELRLADRCAADLAATGLHPGLLDVALGSLYRCRDRGAYAPFGYRRVRVHAPLPQAFASFVRRAPGAGEGDGTLTYDAVLYDPAGAVLVEVEGYTYRRVRLADPLAAGTAVAAGGGPASSAAAAAALGALRGIRTSEGEEAIRRLLGQALPPQIVVAPVDPDRMAAELKALLRRRLGEPRPAAGGAAARGGGSHPRPDLSQPYVAPRDEREEILAGIFGEVLALERVGVEDPFFELGGDSVIALQVIGRAQRAGLSVTPADLFNQPTIAALAALAGIAALAAQAGGPAVSPLPALGVHASGGERPSIWPLSLNQERYWSRYRSGGPSASLNLPIAVGLAGGLVVAALHASLQAIVDRHEALRTVFRQGENGVVQEVLAGLRVPMPELDLTALPDARRAEETRRLSHFEGGFVFALEDNILFRFTLLRLGEAEHRLLTVKHHLITDGWSGGLFAQELAELYAAAVRGVPAQLPALPVQYGDFTFWQREHLGRGGLLAAQLAHWRTTLSEGDFPVLRLPGDLPRQSGGGFASREEVQLLPKELIDELRELVRRENATLFMALLAAVDILLYSRTGLTDLALTTDVANRGQIEVEKLIGLFTNVVVLRSRLDGDPSFRELVARAKQVTLDSFSNQELPFAELMAEIKPGWLELYHEVFPVAFVFQNYPGREFALPGLALSVAEIEPGSVSRDLLMVLGETPRGVRVMFRYRSDYFLPATMRRMVDDLGALLRAAVRDPDQRLSALVAGIGATVPAAPAAVVRR